MNRQIMEESLYQADDQEGYILKSRLVTPPKKNVVLAKKPTTSAKRIVVPPKKMAATPKQQPRPLQPSAHDPIQLKATPQEVRTSDKLSYAFNLESEIQKLKIPFPFIELMKNEAFKTLILKSLQPRTPLDADFVNLQYDKPIVILGPMIEELDESCPPFYISLNIHDKILHSCLLD